VEEVDQVSRCSREAGTQLLTLAGHTHRAVVCVAHTSHDATGCNHSDSAEAVLVCPKSRSHENISATAEATVSTQDDTLTQLVAGQDLVRLSNTHLHKE
jgi:hypothetical protein